MPTKYTDQQQLDRAKRELARLEENLKQMQSVTAGRVVAWELREYARRAGLNCNVLMALAYTVEREEIANENKEKGH